MAVTDLGKNSCTKKNFLKSFKRFLKIGEIHQQGRKLLMRSYLARDNGIGMHDQTLCFSNISSEMHLIDVNSDEEIPSTSFNILTKNDSQIND